MTPPNSEGVTTTPPNYPLPILRGSRLLPEGVRIAPRGGHHDPTKTLKRLKNGRQPAPALAGRRLAPSRKGNSE